MQTVPQVGWTEPGGREPRGGKIWFAFWRLRLMLENGLQRQGVGAERPPTPGGQGSAWLEPVEHPAAGPVERVLSGDSGAPPWLLLLTASLTAARPGADGRLSLSEPQCLYLQNGNKSGCPASLLGIQRGVRLVGAGQRAGAL